MSLSKIPDEILCLIFDRIPVQNQFTICQIFQRWNSVQKLFCSRRRKLTLCISPPENNAADLLNISKFADPFDNSHKNHHSWVEFNELTDQNAQFLVDNFRQISNLVVLYEYATVKTLEHLSLIIKSWKSTLITFKFIFNYKFISNSNFNALKFINLTSLFDTINQLTELRHLTFDTQHQIIDPKATRIFPLNLTQLESLSFKSYDHGSFVCEWFWPFIRSNSNLVKIQFGNSLDYRRHDENQQTIYTLEPKFARKFDYFYIEFPWYRIEFDWVRFCHLFCKLTQLYLDTELYNFLNSQLQSLSQLEHLTNFRLYVTHKYGTRTLPTREQIGTQLAQVLKLCLNVDAENHKILEFIPLDAIFPQIESLYIGKRFLMCCKTSETNCARLFLSPLKAQFAGSKIKKFLFLYGSITSELNIDDL